MARNELSIAIRVIRKSLREMQGNAGTHNHEVSRDAGDLARSLDQLAYAARSIRDLAIATMRICNVNLDDPADDRPSTALRHENNGILNGSHV